MRGGISRRFVCLLGTLAALCCAAPASAASPRIIGGHTAAQGEYPAQGFLERNGFVCGGSLGQQPLLPDGGPLRDGRIEGTAHARRRAHSRVTLGKVNAVRLRGRRRVQRRRQRPPRAVLADRARRQDPRSRRRAAPALATPAPPQPRAAAADRAGRDGACGRRARRPPSSAGASTEDGSSDSSDILLEATVPMVVRRRLRRRGIRLGFRPRRRWCAPAVARRTPAAATRAAR